jgi:hypothetical protein
MLDGVNSSLIYLIHSKNICKCYNVCLPDKIKTFKNILKVYSIPKIMLYELAEMKLKWKKIPENKCKMPQKLTQKWCRK